MQRLNELKALEKEERDKQKKELKALNKILTKTFGMTKEEIDKKLKTRSENGSKENDQNDYLNHYLELKSLSDKLLKMYGHEGEDFKAYVNRREQYWRQQNSQKSGQPS